MKNKKLAIATGFFVSAAIVLGAITLSAKNNNIFEEQKVDLLLDQFANNISVDYRNKEKTETTKIDKSNLIFSGYDKSKYEVKLIDIKCDKIRSNSLEVTLSLKNKFLNIESTATKRMIHGFANIVENIVLNNNNESKNRIITADYNGDKKNVYSRDVKQKDIKFYGLNDETYVVISELIVNDDDEQTLEIIYDLVNKSEKRIIQNNKIKIKGFKKYPVIDLKSSIKSKLDNFIDKITSVNYDGDKTKTIVKKADIKKFGIKNLPKSFEMVSINFKEKADDNTSCILTFKIKSKYFGIASNLKTVEVNNFKKPITKEEIETEANNVIVDFLSNLKELTLADDFENIFPKFGGIDTSKFNIIDKTIVSNIGSKPNFQIKFKIQDKDETLTSNERIFEIKGIRIKKTLDELNEIVSGAKLNVDDELKKLVLSENIDKIIPIFSGYDKDLFEIVDVKLTQNPNNKSILNVAFRIKEISGDIKSDQRVIEIDGYKIWKTKEELNQIINNVTAEYQNGKPNNTVISENKNSISVLLTNLDKSTYDTVDLLIEEKPEDKSVLQIKFKIQEKNSHIKSDEKILEISGFKVRKTINDLNNIIKNINVDINEELKTRSLLEIVKDIKPNFENFDKNIFEVVDLNLEPKEDNPSTLVIKFKLKEKDGIIKSDTRIIEIKNFRVFKSIEELNDEIQKINVNIDAEFKEELIEDNIDVIVPKFENFDRKIFRVSNVLVSEKENNSSILHVSFKLQEIDGTLKSETRTVEIDGFRIKKTLDDLNKIRDEIVIEINDSFKSELLENNISKITPIFKNYDKTLYSIINLNLTQKSDDPSVLVISFKVKEIDGVLKSDERIFEIPGFKVWKTKNELNLEADKVRIRIDESFKNNVLTNDATNVKPEFSGIDKENFELSDIETFKKDNDDSTLVVKFRIKEKDGTKKSDIKTIEIDGFKVFKTVEELDKIAKKVSVSLDENIKKSSIPENLKDLPFELINLDLTKYDFSEINTSVKIDDQSTLVIRFKIQEKDGILKSNEHALEIKGFRVFKSKEELNELIKNINVLIDENYKKIPLENVINEVVTNFENIQNNYKIIDVIKEVKTSDNSTLLVKFKIKEIDGKIDSDIKTVEFKGFKVWKTLDELNVENNKITISIDDKFKSSTAEEFNDLNELNFAGFDKNVYMVVEKKLSVNKNNSSILQIKFSLKEIDGTLKSDERTVEISGFKVWKTKEELNEISNNVSWIFKGDLKSTVLAETKETITVELAGYDKEQYEILNTKFEVKSENKSILFVSFELKEIDGKILSDRKIIEIPGFKTRKTFEEISEEINKIKITVDEKIKPIPLLENINNIIPNFEGYDSEIFEIVDKNISIKHDDNSVLLIKFRLKEKDGKISSDIKTIEIPGFKVRKTLDELNNLINKITAKVSEETKSKPLSENIKNVTPVLDGFDKNIYEIVEKVIVQKTDDKSILQIKFRLKEKDGKISSDIRTIEIPGFKVRKTIEELNEISSSLSVDVPSSFKEYAIFDNIENIDVNFEGLDKNSYFVNEYYISENPNSSNTLQVNFTTQEIGGNLTSDIRTIEIPGFKTWKNLVELNVIADNVKVETVEKASETVISELTEPLELIFSGFDKEQYEIIEKSITNKKDDNSTILVNFKVREKTRKITSYLKTVEINNFKVRKTLEELNSEINKITAKVSEETKSKPLSENIKNVTPVFEGYDNEVFEIVEKNISIKHDDNSVLLIKFRLKEKDGKISSDIKTIEISGFKVRKTLDELNNLINKITAKVSEETKSKPLSENIENINPVIESFDENVYEIVEKVIESKPGKESTIQIKFRLKEKDGKISSDIKTIEISGFKVRKTLDELNKEINKITAKVSEETKSKPLSENIENINPVIEGFDENIYEIVEKIITSKPGDESILQIKLKIKEKDGKISSKVKTLEIPGFKVWKTVKELNNIAKDITVTPVGNKSEIVISEIKEPLEFLIDNYDKNAFELVNKKVINKRGDESTVIYSFQLKEKSGNLKSDLKRIEIKGFKVRKTLNELNQVLEKIKIKYNKEKMKLTRLPKDKSSLNVEIMNYDKNIYEIIDKNIVYDPIRTNVAILSFRIKEIGGNIISELFFVDCNDFQPYKTKNELKKYLFDISVTFNGEKSKTFLRDLNEVYPLTFSGYDKDSLEIINIKTKINDSGDTLTVYFSIKEIGGDVVSHQSDLDIKGFIPWDTPKELTNLTNKVKLNYDEKILKNPIPKNPETLKIDFINYDKSKYEIIQKHFVPYVINPKILLVRFKIRQKGGKNIGEERVIRLNFS